MDVLIVNQYALPAGSAGITRHGDIAAAMGRQGHHVTVLASRFNYLTRVTHTPGEDPDPGVSFRWIASGTYRTNDGRRVRSMVEFSLRALWVGVRVRRPDVVVGSSPHLLAGLVGRLIATYHRVPFVLEIRDLWPSVLVELGALKRHGTTHRILLALERFLYRSANRIIVVPPHAGRRVREVGVDPERCVHVPNATTLTAEDDGPTPASLVPLLKVAPKTDVLVYCGAHGPSNDLATVLRALAILRDDRARMYQRLTTLFIGNGSEKDALLRMAADLGLDRAHFHDPVPKAALPAVLRMASLGIVSFADAKVYDYGLSPNKLFDYMAAGLPVLVASRLSDTPVQIHRTGRTYTPGDPRDLATAIQALLEVSPDERAAMGERGKAAVRDHYTPVATARLFESTLRGAIGERPG